MLTFGHDPLASLDQTLVQKTPPFSSDINVSSPLPSFIDFHPYEENFDPSSFLQELLEHQHGQQITLEEDGVLATDKNDHVLVNKMAEKSKISKDGLLSGYQRNKRSCKKDRHSKIDTAQGPRDRRMRLSLEVARKFFGLQDMLNFDKASKTVEWLLIQSKSAIEEVEATRGHLIFKRDSSNGDGKNNSNNDDVDDDDKNNNSNNDDVDDDDNNNNNSNSSVMMRSTTASSTTSECEVVSGNKMKKNKVKAARISTRKCRSQLFSSHSIIAKESREKARERAKQRTREKINGKMMIMSRSSEGSYTENCEESATQSGQNSNNNMGNPHSLDHYQVVEKMYCADQLRANQEIEGNDDSASLGKWSLCPASSSYNCDLQRTGTNTFSSEQHDHFYEFPLFSKPWEGYPNQFLCYHNRA